METGVGDLLYGPCLCEPQVWQHRARWIISLWLRDLEIDPDTIGYSDVAGLAGDLELAMSDMGIPTLGQP